MNDGLLKSAVDIGMDEIEDDFFNLNDTMSCS